MVSTLPRDWGFRGQLFDVGRTFAAVNRHILCVSESHMPGIVSIEPSLSSMYSEVVNEEVTRDWWRTGIPEGRTHREWRPNYLKTTLMVITARLRILYSMPVFLASSQLNQSIFDSSSTAFVVAVAPHSTRFLKKLAFTTGDRA